MKIATSKTPAGRMIELVSKTFYGTNTEIYTITGSGAIWQNCDTLEDAVAWFKKYESEGCVCIGGMVL